MVKMTRRYLAEMFAMLARILFIFLSLTIATDCIIRLYYSYMPIETWMEFKDVRVEDHDGEAVAVITRTATRKSVSLFHRTLIIKYPEEKRDCTYAAVAVIDDLTTDTVTVPLARMLSPSCPDTIGIKPVNAVLQVSYVFDFPYGVKRFAVRYSNQFTMVYDKGYKLL